MSRPNLDATGHQWVGALSWFNFKLEHQKGHDNTVADVLSWGTTWLDTDTVKSIFNRVALGMVHQVKVHDLAMGEGDQCLEQEVCVATGCTLVWLNVTDWAEARRRLSVEHSVGLTEGTEEDRFESTSGRTCLQWRRQTDATKLTEFSDSSGGLVPTCNPQGWDQRSPALCGPQGPSCCHFEWVPLRCRSSRVWPYLVFVVGALLVARYDQPDVAVYQVLHTLLAAWGPFVQSSPTPNCGHCSNGPLACGLDLHRDDHGGE